ncbi:OmpA family protein [Ferruginibacter sp.]
MNFIKQCICLFVLLLLHSIHVHCQNLFANPGFEDLNNCTEFHADCAPEAWFNIPATNYLVHGSLAPRPMLGHMVLVLPVGSVMENFNKPRFVYTALCCPLKAGLQYDLSFYVNSGKMDFAGLNFYFTSYEPTLATVKSMLTAPISITAADLSGDFKENWKYVKTSYTASGKEKYFVISTFGLPIINYEMRSAMNSSGDILYFIDEIQLKPQIPQPACTGYAATVKTMYDYNYRHSDNLPVFKVTEEKPTVKFTTDTLAIPGLLFDVNSAELKKPVTNILDSLTTVLGSKKFLKVDITGHTDNSGSEKNNLALSAARAEAIKTYLANKFPALTDKFFASGKGQYAPVADNNSSNGKQKNRRVEIVITYINIQQ